MFKTSHYTGVLKDSDSESLELKFVDIKDMPTDLSKPFISVARDLKKQI